MSKLRKEGYAEDTGKQSGNQPREIRITQVGLDYVETFLAAYRGQVIQNTGDHHDREGASSSSSPTCRVDDDDEARNTPISSIESLFGSAIDALEKVEEVALDLETMPPEGWGREVVVQYRTWSRRLKPKPKKDRMRAQWEELKNKTYKK